MSTPSHPTKAVLYPRVSSKKQVLEGNGLQTQEHRCRAYAEAMGYEVVAVFPEESLSGAVIHRPAMQRLLAFLEAQSEEIVVIIDDLKRFARHVGVYFELKLAIHVRGGRLESPLFRFEDTPEGKFVETVVAAQAELERNQNQRQVVNRMKARLEMGFWPFHAPPGYRWRKDPEHHKVLERDQPRAGLIQEALEGFAEGRFAAPVEVQRFLTSAGYFGVVTNPHRSTYLGQVHRLLRQMLYTGHVEYHPWGVSLRKGHHPALIPLATFQRIQERLNAKPAPLARTDTRADFALRNFVACTACGRAMTASWSRGRSQRYPYYHCQEKNCPEYGKTIARGKLEAEFEEMLQGITSSPEVLDLMRLVSQDVWDRKTSEREQQAAAREKRLRELEVNIRALADRLARTSSEVACRAIETRIEELERERLSVEQEAGAPPPDVDFGTAFEQVRMLIENPLLLWKTEDLETKRLVPRLAFTSLLLYDRKSGFGTAELSLPYLISGHIAANKSSLVDLPQETWNQFLAAVLEWSILLKNCPRLIHH